MIQVSLLWECVPKLYFWAWGGNVICVKAQEEHLTAHAGAVVGPIPGWNPGTNLPVCTGIARTGLWVKGYFSSLRNALLVLIGEKNLGVLIPLEFEILGTSCLNLSGFTAQFILLLCWYWYQINSILSSLNKLILQISHNCFFTLSLLGALKNRTVFPEGIWLYLE